MVKLRERGSVLDARERLVDKQHVREMFCAVRSEIVDPDAAESKVASSFKQGGVNGR
jgi:hypothetical protein